MDLSSRSRPALLREFGAPRAAPPPGSAKPGNLYADLQSRTLWLGVDPSIDPAQAVLVSDIISLTDAIVEAEAEAKGYTDTQMLTRAPLVHHHVAADITDFDEAVADAALSVPGLQWVRGMIMMYSGSLAEIGSGGLAGWSLCDGSNGTPDLRDRFVLGAGNLPIGGLNDAKAINTAAGGAHTHTIDGTALATAHMPYHSHGGITGYFSNDHQHYVSGNTSDQSTNHTHALTLNGRNFMEYVGGSGGQGTTGGGMGQVANTNWNDRGHYHSVNFWSGGQSANHYHAIPAEGGGAAHTHSMGSGGDHAHSISAGTLRDGLGYAVLAYIMKL